MLSLIGNLNRCLVQEIANRDERSLRIPFIPFKDSPLYVDYGSFIADAGKSVFVLQKKGDTGYYETVVSNTLQKSAMRRSGNQIFYLRTTAELHMEQKFQIGTTECTPTTQRPTSLLFKQKVLVGLRLCIVLDTGQVGVLYLH